MRRIGLVVVIAVSLAVSLILAPIVGEAQQATKVHHLGILGPASFGEIDYLVAGLRELGYIEGQNLAVESRYAEGHLDRLPILAAELVRQSVDVIVAVSPIAIGAARDTTKTIPIVMGFGSEPVERGFVASLAHPGGNITDVTLVADTTLAGKRLQFIKEAVPQAKRVAALFTAQERSGLQVREARNAAARLDVGLVLIEARGQDYEEAFTRIRAERAAALFVLSSPVLFADRKPVIELAVRGSRPRRTRVATDTGNKGSARRGIGISGRSPSSWPGAGYGISRGAA
jgi:putative tryptophan/tyrosine transport system substrate-binding protein